MIYHTPILIITLMSLLPFSAIAGQNTIRLICKYSHTINYKGISNPTSGESLFTVNYSNDGKASVKKQDLGAIFIGSISEEEIYAKANYTIQDIAFNQTLIINRYTGSFELTFGITGKSGIIHFGKCKSATEKLF